MCVRERERETDRQTECVFVCVCVGGGGGVRVRVCSLCQSTVLDRTRSAVSDHTKGFCLFASFTSFETT